MKSYSIRLNDETGQMLIIGVAVLTIIMVVGAIVVDVGLWVSERRGAQSDADFAALAGAWELVPDPGRQAEARNAVDASIAANNEQGNALLDNNIDFNGGCVTLDVEHKSNPVFASIFKVVAPEIGAHAQACAGATNAPRNLIPLQIDSNNDVADCFDSRGRPKFGELCALDYGVNGLKPLDLEAGGDDCSDPSGDGDVENLIRDGVPGTCLINDRGSCGRGPWYDCMAAERIVPIGTPNGVTTENVIDGMLKRIEPFTTSICDTEFGNGDGFDQLGESVDLVFDTGDPATSVYQAKDCDPSTAGKQISPRLVTIVVLDQAPGNSPNQGNQIKTFASLFVAGCRPDNLAGATEADVDADCEDASVSDEELDHEVIYASFVNLIVEGSDVGPASPSTTSFSIALTE